MILCFEKNMKRHIPYIGLGLSPLIAIPLAHYLCIAPYGDSVYLVIVIGLVASIFLVALCTPILFVILFIQRKRRLALYFLMYGILFFITGFIGIKTGLSIRSYAFYSLAERSKPLVEAIHRYEQDHGTPPKELTDLTPHYIQKIPSTGMAAYPEYHYETNKNPEHYEGNPWILFILTT